MKKILSLHQYSLLFQLREQLYRAWDMGDEKKIFALSRAIDTLQTQSCPTNISLLPKAN